MNKIKPLYPLTWALITMLSFNVLAVSDDELMQYQSDWATPQAIINAMYETISADPGKKRDWIRFRELFFDNAQVLISMESTQFSGIMASDVEQLISLTESAYGQTGFHEIETAQKITQYGNMANVYSSYEIKLKLSDTAPLLKGLNHFQLLFDGDRWWIISNTSIIDNAQFEASTVLN